MINHQNAIYYRSTILNVQNLKNQNSVFSEVACYVQWWMRAVCALRQEHLDTPASMTPMDEWLLGEKAELCACCETVNALAVNHKTRMDHLLRQQALEAR